MERLKIEPRPNWTKEVETLGFDFYTMDGVPYWGEDACYRFTAAEVDIIEEAANKLHKLCVYAVQRIVDMRLFPLLGIDPEIGRLITESWERREPAVYGRFDLIYDGTAPPKLLEYNADTPTSLFEASIVQWNWREQRFPKADQFNSIHDSLVARWRSFLVGRRNADRLHVTCATPMPEDETTVQYIGATAQEAGYRVKFLPIQEVGWDEGLKRFVDLDGEPIQTLFKLYPWEWIVREDFGANVKPSGALFLEPMWKMLLSNKGLLPILWEMFPEHENLLPAYREPGPSGTAQSYASRYWGAREPTSGSPKRAGQSPILPVPMPTAALSTRPLPNPGTSTVTTPISGHGWFTIAAAEWGSGRIGPW